MSRENSPKQSKSAEAKQVSKDTPVSRADKAYESIRQTLTLNQRLEQLGVVSTSFGLKKTR